MYSLTFGLMYLNGGTSNPVPKRVMFTMSCLTGAVSVTPFRGRVGRLSHARVRMTSRVKTPFSYLVRKE